MVLMDENFSLEKVEGLEKTWTGIKVSIGAILCRTSHYGSRFSGVAWTPVWARFSWGFWRKIRKFTYFCLKFSKKNPSLLKACIQPCTAPVGLGNRRNINISLHRPPVHGWHWGDIFVVKALLKPLLKSGQVYVITAFWCHTLGMSL